MNTSSPLPRDLIERRIEPGLHSVLVSKPGLTEVHMTLLPLGQESWDSCVGRLAQAIDANSVQVLRMDVLSHLQAFEAGMKVFQKRLSDLEFPLTWVQGSPCRSSQVLAGVHVWGVSGVPVKTLRSQGEIVGRTYQSPQAQVVCLGHLLPEDVRLDRETQARQVFGVLQTVLEEEGLSLRDLVRTWFFVDRILDWYSGFNQVRTRFFQDNDLFSKSLPASTGVSGRNPQGASLVAGAIAIKPLSPQIAIEEIPSPLQCSATEYGSSFSRAMECRTPESVQIWISGTASIDPEGRTIHPGDFEAQVAQTVRVTQGILESRRMGLQDAARGTAYLKTPRDLARLTQWLSDHQLADLPLVIAHNEICRDDLLFEMELEAIGSLRPLP